MVVVAVAVFVVVVIVCVCVVCVLVVVVEREIERERARAQDRGLRLLLPCFTQNLCIDTFDSDFASSFALRIGRDGFHASARVRSLRFEFVLCLLDCI